MGIKHGTTKAAGQRVFAVADWNADHQVTSNLDISPFDFITTGSGDLGDLRLRFDATKYVDLVPTATGDLEVLPTTGDVYLEANAGDKRVKYWMTSYDDTDQSDIILQRSKGTKASQDPVVAGNVLGRLRFEGWDGSGWDETARIQSTVQSIAGGHVTGKLKFFTTDATGTSNEVGSFDRDGLLTVEDNLNVKNRIGVNQADPKGDIHIGARFLFDVIGTGNYYLNNAYHDGSWHRIQADECGAFTLNADGSFSFIRAPSAAVHIAPAWVPVFRSLSNGHVNVNTNVDLGGQFNVEGAVYINNGDLTVDTGDIYLKDDNKHFYIGNSTTQFDIFNNGTDGCLQTTSTIRIGNVTTNYTGFDGSGLMYFVGNAGLPFGSCSCYEIGWTQVAAQNTWYNVADAAFIDGQIHDVTHDGNGKLTIVYKGVYKVDVAIDWEISAANKHIEVGFEIDGSGSAATEGIVCSEGKFANEEEGISTTALLDLDAGDTIELCVRTTDVGNPTLKVNCVSLNCIQIGG